MENIPTSSNAFKQISEKTNALQNANSQQTMKDENKNTIPLQNSSVMVDNSMSQPGYNSSGFMQDGSTFQSQVIGNGLGKLDSSINEIKDDKSMQNILDKPKFGLGNIFNCKILGATEMV